MADLTQLHDRDFYGWTQAAARALRDGQVTAADLQVIAEEVEDMGKSERRALSSRLEGLVTHLLKWRCQPDLRSRSWRLTIEVQRRHVQRLLAENPSLRPHLPDLLADCYESARLLALAETGLGDAQVPEACPFGVEDVLAGELA